MLKSNVYCRLKIFYLMYFGDAKTTACAVGFYKTRQSHAIYYGFGIKNYESIFQFLKLNIEEQPKHIKLSDIYSKLRTKLNDLFHSSEIDCKEFVNFAQQFHLKLPRY